MSATINNRNGNRGGLREIPVAPLRAAFLRSGMKRTDVARVLGWTDSRGCPDGQRFARAIGLVATPHGRGYGMQYRQTTSYERAVELAEAMGYDPVDFGL